MTYLGYIIIGCAYIAVGDTGQSICCNKAVGDSAHRVFSCIRYQFLARIQNVAGNLAVKLIKPLLQL